MSVKDIFDNNAYANDPRTQFMNWAFVAKEAWDFPADSIGFITGFAAELNQPKWALRYGFFQLPRVSNGVGIDMNYLKAWGMVLEFERRYNSLERMRKRMRRKSKTPAARPQTGVPVAPKPRMPLAQPPP